MFDINQKPLRYCIYIRVSTDDQAKNGTSLESQREALLNVIHRDPNASIDEARHIFIDDGYSGLTDNRPGFTAMMEAVKKKEFDVIAVLNLDRFFRKLTLASKYLEMMRGYDVKFKSINQPFDTTTEIGVAICQILFVFANMEANLIASRTKLGKRTRAEVDKKYVGGSLAPYGYRLEDRTLFIDDNEAPIVRRIFDMYVNEKKKVSEICKIFTAENLPIRSAKKMKQKKMAEKENRIEVEGENKWTGSLIYKILKNTIYYGKYYYGRRSKTRVIPEPGTLTEKHRKYKYSFNPESEWVAMTSPRILGSDEEEGMAIYKAAQSLLEDNKRTGKFGDYLFSGKIRSAVPDYYSYVGSRNRSGSVVYKIHQATTKPNHSQKVGIQVQEEELVESVIEFLKDLISAPSSKMEKLLKEKVYNDDRVKGYTNEIEGYEKRLSEIDKEVTNFMNAIAKYGSLAPDLEKSVDKLIKDRALLYVQRDQKKALIENMEKAHSNIPVIRESLLRFKGQLDSLSYETKKELAKSLVERIWVDLDRHYRFELSISEDIKKYFDDSDDGAGTGKTSKKPTGPKGSKGSGTSPTGSTNDGISLGITELREGGQNNNGLVMNSSSSPSSNPTGAANVLVAPSNKEKTGL